MRGNSDAVREALTGVARGLSAEMTSSGWIDRGLGPPDIADLTQKVQGGIMATVRFQRTSFQWPGGWPVETRLWLGVGYEPALDLMPLLTVKPAVSLLHNPSTGGRRGVGFTLESAGDVLSVTWQMIALIDQHAVQYAERFADAMAIDAALRDEPSSSDALRNLATDRRLTLLAAAGRHEEARALLDGYPGDRRFVRQLTRWLDAGGPPIPPLADTLARLTAEPPAARIGGGAEQPQDDREPVAVRQKAMPLRRGLRAFRGLRDIATATGDVISMIRHPAVDGPEWLRPPDRAAFPIHAGNDRTTVVLDPDAAEWLATADAAATRRVGPFALVDVWFTRSDGGDLVAHIGDRRVGTLPARDADRFAGVLRAAAQFDEDPFVLAAIRRPGNRVALRLEIPLPAE